MNPDYGRASRETGSTAVRFLWQEADKANANSQLRACGGEWVPWRCIEVRDGVTPRETREDPDAVEHYMTVLDELPPLVVQRDTFVLIGGWNRLAANVKAERAIVRVVELPCSDDELWERAFEDNAIHGLQMTTKERVRAMRRYAEAHPSKIDREIAEWAGVVEETVQRWRRSLRVAHENDQQRAVTSAEPTKSESSLPQVSVPESENRSRFEHKLMNTVPGDLAPTDPPRMPTTFGASGTAPPEEQPRVTMITFGAIVHQSAIDVMDQVPEDKLGLQLHEIDVAIEWLQDARYHLRSRMSELVADGIPF